MKMRFALPAAALALLSPASANEAADQCRAYVAEHGGDASGCDCLGAKAADDATLADALSRIEAPADLEAADVSTKEAIAACFPDSDAG
jgi:hypothetical protein